MLPEQAAAVFKERFDAAPDFLIRAPGRVNLIGDHTDYTGGFGGTSAACPYAAGAAAALQSAFKARTGAFLTPDQVKAYLTKYGDPITDPKSGIITPRINLARTADAITSSPALAANNANKIVKAATINRMQ